jgi:peroxiredoxin
VYHAPEGLMKTRANMTMQAAGAIAFTAALAAATVALAAQSPAASTCTATKPANLEFTLKDLHGRDVRLSSFHDKILVVNFWATWCAPCRVEIPGFMDLYRRYRSRGVEVIGIAADEPPDVLEPYVRQMAINYPVLIGRGHQEVLDSFGQLLGMPTTVIIDRDGTICQRYVGFQRKQTFEDLLKKLTHS